MTNLELKKQLTFDVMVLDVTLKQVYSNGVSNVLIYSGEHGSRGCHWSDDNLLMNLASNLEQVKPVIGVHAVT